MKKILWMTALTVVFSVSAAQEKVKVIFDTDMAEDYDDVGALAILHAMADAGEAEILATVANTRTNRSVAVVEVINRYYGRPDIPVGIGKEAVAVGGGDGFGLMQKYPKSFRYANSSDAPDAVAVYRKALAAQPDKSVTICSVGFMTNLRLLIESKADAFSPLNGRDLVEKKVKLWVAMACSYPKGKEYNSKTDAASSKIAFDTWPTPVLFTDFQYGCDLFTGRAVAESAGENNPVKDVFLRMLLAREKVTPRSWDRVNGHPSWDETAVLAAVRGTGKYFGTERGRYAMVGTDGSNVWIPSPDGPHARLTVTMPKAEVGKVIDQLMLAAPKKQGGLK